MRYFEKLRIEWLKNFKGKYLNRSHVMEKFGVGSAQASKDIKKMLLENKGVWVYDYKNKRYVRRK